MTAAAMTSAANSAPPNADAWLDFHVDASLLPTANVPPSEDEKKLCIDMSTLFAAAPHFDATPSLKFQDLGVPPCFVHAFIGGAMWEN